MLLDHFHPPLRDRRHWTSFHHAWACAIASGLNRILPEGWFAEPHVQFGIEIDAAVADERLATVGSGRAEPTSPLAFWTPPEPRRSFDFSRSTDAVEVRVFHDQGGANLAGAIELVSPANKDRPETRDAFVTKCASYLHDAVGLIIVDIVTESHASLHVGLMERLGQVSPEDESSSLYAASYRPTDRDEHPVLDVWHEALVLGARIEALPLFLKNGPCVRVSLNDAYRQACQDVRIPVPPPPTSGS